MEGDGEIEQEAASDEERAEGGEEEEETEEEGRRKEKRGSGVSVVGETPPTSWTGSRRQPENSAGSYRVRCAPR